MKRKLTLLSLSFVLAGALALLLGSQPAQARRVTTVPGGNPGISYIASDPDRSGLELDPDDYQPMPLPTPDQPPQPPQPPKPPQEPDPETPVSSGGLETGALDGFDPDDYRPMPLPTPKQPPRPPRKPEEPVNKVTGTLKTRGAAGGGRPAVKR